MNCRAESIRSIIQSDVVMLNEAVGEVKNTRQHTRKLDAEHLQLLRNFLLLHTFYAIPELIFRSCSFQLSQVFTAVIHYLKIPSQTYRSMNPIENILLGQVRSF